EIGRLREIAFRAAGGGTGKAMDIDENKCEGIRINQSLMGRMLGFGSIVVTTGGVTNKFDFITNPIKFRNEINAQIQ
ncbi:PH domain-containing protein, partial [Phocaeicola vulgatus]|nr:PH domain-containing protein [Phocaeicola vulgatus]